MKAMLLVFVAACGRTAAPEALVTGGSLISIAEGEHRSFSLASRSELGADAPAWAHFAADGNGVIDHAVLVLEPPCTLITGTDGSPRVVELELVPSGGQPTLVVVEIQPTSSGECAPTLSGSIHTVARMGANSDGSNPCSVLDASGEVDPIAGARIDISYSAPTILDKALVFTLVNPDPADVLDVRFTTMAPLRFHSSTNAPGTYCATLPNDNITGSFDLDYAIMRGADPATPTVASGHYLLGWNDHGAEILPYGAQLLWCASSGTRCSFTRTFTGSQWCVDRDAGSRVTLGFRVWALHGNQDGTPYNLTIGATWQQGGSGPIPIVAPPNLGPGNVTFEADADAIPFDAIVDLGGAPDSVIGLSLVGTPIGNATLARSFTVPWSTSIALGCH